MRQSEIPFTQEYVIENLEVYLYKFFNVLWGAPEQANQRIEQLNLKNQPQARLPFLQLFIDHFPEISTMKGWKDSSILASALSIESWLNHSGEKYDEYIVLLSLFKLTTELGVEDEQTDLFRYGIERALIENNLI